MFRFPARLTLAFVVALCSGMTSVTLLFASPPDDATQTQLIDLEKQSWVAWKNHDAKFFQSFLAGDHVEMLSRGPVGKDTVLRVVGDAICTVGLFG